MTDKEIPLIKAKKTLQKDVTLDNKGFFVIQLQQKKIQVEYYSNVYKNNKIISGRLEKIFSGNKANALCDIIIKHVPILRPEHYTYLGRELQRAENALKNDTKYVQNGC